MPKAARTFGKRPGKRTWPRQGSKAERGYGSDWEKLAAQVRADRNHLCEDCAEQGRLTTDGLQVHHLQPFRGLDDPRRLDPSNLRLLCPSCHRKREHARKRQG